MDWDVFAPMLVMITAILTAGGVLVLRPLSKRVAELLEVIARRERTLPPGHDIDQLRELLATLESRLSLLEERQAFTDSLLSAGNGRPEPLPAPSEPAQRGSRGSVQSARKER